MKIGDICTLHTPAFDEICVYEVGPHGERVGYVKSGQPCIYVCKEKLRGEHGAITIYIVVLLNGVLRSVNPRYISIHKEPG